MPSKQDADPSLCYVILYDGLLDGPNKFPAYDADSDRDEEFSEDMIPAATEFRKLAREAGRVISRMPKLTEVVSPIVYAGQSSAIHVEHGIRWLAALFDECSGPIQEHDFLGGDGPEFNVRLTCSVFAASEIVCDKFIELLSSERGTVVNEPLTAVAKRFRISLSFPGEHRDFVCKAAERLASAVGRKRVLYDHWHEAEFARPRLAEYLPDLYHNESELVAVFLSAEYQSKEWCGLEWDAILDLKKKREDDAIMLLRFDDTEIPGLYSTDGHVWIGSRSPEKIADLILEHLQFNMGATGNEDRSVSSSGQ
jgi:TIR domain-containing protein